MEDGVSNVKADVGNGGVAGGKAVCYDIGCVGGKRGAGHATAAEAPHIGGDVDCRSVKPAMCSWLFVMAVVVTFVVASAGGAAGGRGAVAEDVDEFVCIVGRVIEDVEDGDVLVTLDSEGGEYEFVDSVVEDDMVMVGIDPEGVVYGGRYAWTVSFPRSVG